MLTFHEAATSPGVIEAEDYLYNNQNEMTEDGYPVYRMVTFPDLKDLGLQVWMGEDLFVPLQAYAIDPDRKRAFEDWLGEDLRR